MLKNSRCVPSIYKEVAQQFAEQLLYMKDTLFYLPAFTAATAAIDALRIFLV